MQYDEKRDTFFYMLPVPERKRTLHFDHHEYHPPMMGTDSSLQKLSYLPAPYSKVHVRGAGLEENAEGRKNNERLEAIDRFCRQSRIKASDESVLARRNEDSLTKSLLF